MNCETSNYLFKFNRVGFEELHVQKDLNRKSTLRLKTPLKIKENFIGNRTITKETKTYAEPS